MGIPKPKKTARDVFRSYGATILERTPYGTNYQFPDGRTLHVNDNASPGWVAAQIRNLRDWYGEPDGERPAVKGANRPGKPRLDLERVRASNHAKERLALMQQQGGVTYREVLLALRAPERVLWSEPDGSWLWVRDRLAVAVAEAGEWFVITTVLWSTRDLFEQYPRPA